MFVMSESLIESKGRLNSLSASVFKSEMSHCQESHGDDIYENNMGLRIHRAQFR